MGLEKFNILEQILFHISLQCRVYLPTLQSIDYPLGVLLFLLDEVVQLIRRDRLQVGIEFSPILAGALLRLSTDYLLPRQSSRLIVSATCEWIPPKA